MIKYEFEQRLAEIETMSGKTAKSHIPNQNELAANQKLADERKFKPKLDMAIDKTLRHKYFNLEQASQRNMKIKILLDAATARINKQKTEEKEIQTITSLFQLDEKEKKILFSILRGLL